MHIFKAYMKDEMMKRVIAKYKQVVEFFFCIELMHLDFSFIH